MARTANRKAVSSTTTIASHDEKLSEVNVFSRQVKDPLEGVEYITGKDGQKRPMSWYRAQAQQAQKETPVQKYASFMDTMLNPRW